MAAPRLLPVHSPGTVRRDGVCPTIDDEVADDYTPNPALYPRSEELKEVIVAPSSDFTDIVTTQTTGGKIWDAARKLLDYLVADGLGDVRSVLELGAGCGWLGEPRARVPASRERRPH